MGLFDSVSSAVNRKIESADRAGDKVVINGKLKALNKQRQQLAAQLGAALYLATKDNPAMREGREALYESIAACDAERDQLQARIAQLDSMSEASAVFNCAVCGSKMSGGDLFCSGCGTPIEQARASAPAAQPAANTVFCGSCGASMDADDAFCMSCGAKVGEVPAAAEATEDSTEVVVAEFVEISETAEAGDSATAEKEVEKKSAEIAEGPSEDAK